MIQFDIRENMRISEALQKLVSPVGLCTKKTRDKWQGFTEGFTRREFIYLVGRALFASSPDNFSRLYRMDKQAETLVGNAGLQIEDWRQFFNSPNVNQTPKKPQESLPAPLNQEPDVEFFNPDDYSFKDAVQKAYPTAEKGRYEVLEPCAVVSGRVVGYLREDDGEMHVTFDVDGLKALDPKTGKFEDIRKKYRLSINFEGEIVPGFTSNKNRLPFNREKAAAIGSLVRDHRRPMFEDPYTPDIKLKPFFDIKSIDPNPPPAISIMALGKDGDLHVFVHNDTMYDLPQVYTAVRLPNGEILEVGTFPLDYMDPRQFIYKGLNLPDKVIPAFGHWIGPSAKSSETPLFEGESMFFP